MKPVEPVPVSYRWADPADVEALGEGVRRLVRRAATAELALHAVAASAPGVMSGAAADAARTVAAGGADDAGELATALDLAGRALVAHADVLRDHRDRLDDLHADAVRAGLEVRGGSVVAPDPSDAPRWRSWMTCREQADALEQRRLEATRPLVVTLVATTGERPQPR